MYEDSSVLELYCRVCVVIMDKEPRGMTMELWVDVEQMPMAYNNDYTYLVSELLPVVENEESQKSNNDIYQDLGAVV